MARFFKGQVITSKLRFYSTIYSERRDNDTIHWNPSIRARTNNFHMLWVTGALWFCITVCSCFLMFHVQSNTELQYAIKHLYRSNNIDTEQLTIVPKDAT